MIGLTRAWMDATLDNVDAALADMEAELETLAGKVARLESHWDGEAREAFATAMREWRAQIDDLHRVGAELNRVARGSVTRLDEFDRRRASAWRR